MNDYKFFDGKRYRINEVFSNKEEAKSHARKLRKSSPYKNKGAFARVEIRINNGRPVYLVWVRYFIHVERRTVL